MNIETINYFLQCWVGFGAFVFLVTCLLIGVPSYPDGKPFSVKDTVLVMFGASAAWPLLVVALWLDRDVIAYHLRGLTG